MIGGMTRLYPFIWGSLKDHLASCFLIISCKISIVTVISNEKPNELTIYVKLCQKSTIFYRQELASLFQVQKKNWESAVIKNKLVANDSHIKFICSYTVVFKLQAILYFWDNFHLLKYQKYLKTPLIHSIAQIKQASNFPNFVSIRYDWKWTLTSQKNCYLLHWKPFRNDEKCFLFHLKNSFRSQDI